MYTNSQMKTFAKGGDTKASSESNEFKKFMYSAGEDPALATQLGIQYARQKGWSPEKTTEEWNKALGTNFTVDDFYRVTGLTPTTQTFTKETPSFSNFGESGSWDFGAGTKYDDKGLITSTGNYFERGNDAIVSDELLWNPHSATGKELQNKVQTAKDAGQRAGAVVTPYAVFQNKATTEQLLDEVKNSGVDFVVIDPYVGLGVPGVTSEGLLNWTRDFINQAKSLGKDVKVVTQGFAQKGQEEEALRHNQQVLALPGVSEFINFGLEDAKDLTDNPNWVSLSNDYGALNQKQPPAPTPPAQAPTIQSPAPEQTQLAAQPPAPYYVTGLAGVQRPVDPTTGYMYETEVGGNRMRGWGGGDLSVRDGQIYEGEELPYYMRLQNNRMVATGAQAPAPAPVFGEPPKGLASLVKPNTQLADLAQHLSSLPSSPPQPTPPTPIPPEPDMFDTTEQFGNIQNGITMPENYRRGGRVRMI